MIYRNFGKRLLDISIATLALVALLPILGLVALLVWVTMGKPIIFCQRRPGLHGKPFTIYKFRTMTETRSKNGKLLPSAERLTTFGKFLRASSLDELPELWNIIKGDMSLVGPRPLLMEYLNLYTPEQASRHLIRPGLTGWAQINGRNALTWEEKFNLDQWYVKNYDLKLDFKIIAITFLKLLRREGVTPHDSVTMKRFTGSK